MKQLQVEAGGRWIRANQDWLAAVEKLLHDLPQQTILIDDELYRIKDISFDYGDKIVARINNEYVNVVVLEQRDNWYKVVLQDGSVWGVATHNIVSDQWD